jgi:hypothetical protein
MDDKEPMNPGDAGEYRKALWKLFTETENWPYASICSRVMPS